METKIIKQTFYKQVLPPECEFPNKILTKFLTSNSHDQAIWENEKRYSILFQVFGVRERILYYVISQ